jgi:putative Holliday junction resolvase
MHMRFPESGRLAGVDYGHVRLGLAICDPLRRLASPLETYTRCNAKRDAEFFRRLVQQEQLVGFVVGLPVHSSARESQKSREARQFGAWLAEISGKPVCFFDERYTTVEADQLLGAAEVRGRRRKQKRDAVAAQILLTSFLESPAAAERAPLPLDDDDAEPDP